MSKRVLDFESACEEIASLSRQLAERDADLARKDAALREICALDGTEIVTGVDGQRYEDGPFAKIARAALAGSGDGWRDMADAPNNQEVLIAYWRWRNSMSPGTMVVQSAMLTEFHGSGIWSWVVSDNKHGPFPIRGWCEGDVIGWRPLPASPSTAGER